MRSDTITVPFTSHTNRVTASPASRGGYIEPLVFGDGRWRETAETNPQVRGLYRRHKAWRLNGHKPRSFGISGDKLILITPQADALIIFRKHAASWDKPEGPVQVMAFRNEGHFRSCSLIREAINDWAWKRWPGKRLFVCVPGRRIVASNPGFAFRCAGWQRCSIGEDGLVMMELLPAN